MPIPSATVAELFQSGVESATRAAAGSALAAELAPGQGPDLTRYALVCCGLLVAVVAVAALFKRLLGGAIQRRAAARSLQIIDVLPLGGKQRLAVVRCYDRTFLLGLGEKELTSISELDAVIAPAREAAATRADLQAFSGVLERAAAKITGATRRTGLSKEGVLG